VRRPRASGCGPNLSAIPPALGCRVGTLGPTGEERPATAAGRRAQPASPVAWVRAGLYLLCGERSRACVARAQATWLEEYLCGARWGCHPFWLTWYRNPRAVEVQRGHGEARLAHLVDGAGPGGKPCPYFRAFPPEGSNSGRSDADLLILDPAPRRTIRATEHVSRTEYSLVVVLYATVKVTVHWFISHGCLQNSATANVEPPGLLLAEQCWESRNFLDTIEAFRYDSYLG
jgi:hypothetical protein